MNKTLICTTKTAGTVGQTAGIPSKSPLDQLKGNKFTKKLAWDFHENI